MSNIIKRAYAIELARLCADNGVSPAWLIKKAARATTREELERRQQEAIAAFEEKMRRAREQFEEQQRNEIAAFEEEKRRAQEEQVKRKKEWEREQEEFNRKLDEENASRKRTMSRERHDKIVEELVEERNKLNDRIGELEADQTTMQNPGAAKKVKDYNRMQEENQNLQKQISDAEHARDSAQQDLKTEISSHETTRSALSAAEKDRDAARRAYTDTAHRLRHTVYDFDKYKNRPWHKDITGGLSKGWNGLKDWASSNKPITIAGGTALAGGLGYYLYNRVKKNRAKKRLLSALSE